MNIVEPHHIRAALMMDGIYAPVFGSGNEYASEEYAREATQKLCDANPWVCASFHVTTFRTIVTVKPTMSGWLGSMGYVVNLDRSTKVATPLWRETEEYWRDTDHTIKVMARWFEEIKSIPDFKEKAAVHELIGTTLTERKLRA